MSALIGRHGHGGGGHGGGGRGRRFFGGGGGWGGWGGWGWDWPWPYAYPYAYGQPSYASYEYESDESVGAAVAALAPGADGLACQMTMGPDLRLHVSILVDGRRHETSVDLSSLLCDIAEKASRAHAWRGGSAPSAEAAVRDMTAQTANAVKSAGAILVGALYDRHVGEVCGGFWDSLKSAYRTVSTPVTWFHKAVAKTIQKVPGLKQAVTVAATAVATAYGGPAAGAAASRLTGPIIDSSAETGGDPTMLFEKTKQDAHRASGGDPKVAQAITHAEKAITQTAAAYTLKSLASSASAGDLDSARKIGEIQQAAQAGDSASARAMQILSEIQRASADGPPPGSPGPGYPATSVGLSGVDLDYLRELAASSAARARLTHGSGEAVVFVLSPAHGQFAVPFDSRMEAVRYVHHVDPRSISYLAVIDVSDPGSPFLLAERSFGGRGLDAYLAAHGPAAGAPTASSGAFLPFALGAAAGAFGGAWWQRTRAA